MTSVSNTEISKALTDLRIYVEGEFLVARGAITEATKDRNQIRVLTEKHERILIGKNGDPGVMEMMRDLKQKVVLLLKIVSFIGISVGGWLLGQLLGLI